MNEQGLPHPGSWISEFELGEPIGVGGFGAVYQAFQPRLNRDVAVKILFPEAAQSVEHLARRFLREIDLARRLEHPNIVRLYDYGETEQGLLWMAMELVRGEELSDVLKREGAIEPKRVRRIMLQVLSALSEAHELNIVHRDLKPGNIMLTRKGADKDVVKLLDFGIGKAFGERENSALQDLTVGETGIFGTPRYMAPELLMRENEGTHSDVYAAGLILYEMLAGHPAIEGDSTFQILARQMKEAIALDAALARSSFAPVIACATHKDWSKRYPTALEFHEALSRVDVTARLDEALNLDSSPSLLRVDTQRNAALRRSHDDLSAITGDILDDFSDVMEVTVVEDDGTETVEALGTSRPSLPPTSAVEAESSSRRPLVILAALITAAVVLGVVALLLTSGGSDETPTAVASTPAQQAPRDETLPSDEATSDSEAAALDSDALLAGAEPIETAADDAPLDTAAVDEPVPAEPDTVTVELTTTPPGARAVLGDIELCAATPCTVELERSDTPVDIELSLDGHRSHTETVATTEGGHFDIALRAKRSRADDTATKKKKKKHDDAGNNPFEMRAD